MLTYLNAHCERTEVTNKEDVARWYAINAILESLDEEAFEKALEIIGNYVWNGGRANANKIRGLAKRMKVNWEDLELWYLLED